MPTDISNDFTDENKAESAAFGIIHVQSRVARLNENTALKERHNIGNHQALNVLFTMAQRVFTPWKPHCQLGAGSVRHPRMHDESFSPAVSLRKGRRIDIYTAGRGSGFDVVVTLGQAQRECVI